MIGFQCPHCGESLSVPSSLADKAETCPRCKGAARVPAVDGPRDMPPGLLEFLDNSNGTDELYEMLRTRPAAEIEHVCRSYPGGAIHLDWESIQSDFRNNQRFELITMLAQILVRYAEILTTSPERRLPAGLPAERLAAILMSRIMALVNSQRGTEIAHGLRVRLYDFAMSLMQAGRDGDALACLIASKPSLKEDHDFWICACRFNIAQRTKFASDVAAAREVAQNIADGTLKVPSQYVGGAKQILSKLAILSPDAPPPGTKASSPPNTANAVSAENRRKAIYSRFLEIEKKTSRTGAEDILGKVRVSSGQNPFAAGAAALLGARMSGALDPEQDALKQVTCEFGITSEHLREILVEGRKKKWA